MSEYLRKNKSIQKRAKSVDDAVEAALKELGISRSEAEIEIIDEGAKGFLGIGAREAVVKVTVKEEAVKEEKNEAVEVSKKEVTENLVKEESKEQVLNKTAGDPEEAAKKFLTDIFKAMELEVEVKTSIRDNMISIELDGENMGIVIGKRGDTLDSLQYLTSLVVNQNRDEYIKVSIDTENYREKRTEALLALSTRLGEKVAKSGKKFTLEPMNPYERRIIHSNLQNSESVTTFSIGQEPYRKVVIAPKNKPQFKKNNNYKKRGGNRRKSYNKENTTPEVKNETVAEKKGSYTTTYKADFKPQQHKAEYKNIDEYFADHSE